jgi:hypothetical protein
MTNFKQLNQNEYGDVWNEFYRLFDFSPSIDTFPAIRTDKPQLIFDIHTCFRSNYPFDKLEEFALHLFNSISDPGDRLYALDWQHECYDFDPRAQMDRNEFDEWIIPVLPNGDYYIFSTKDFKNVWFGHPWEKTITLIGEDIVIQSQKNKDGFPI